jgi:multiple sugar transport system permease protein
MRRTEKLYAYLLFLPAFIFLVFIRIYPVFNGLYLSFTNMGLVRGRNTRFIGFENLIKVLTDDPQFWSVLGFTFVYTFGTVIIGYFFGLLVAALVNNDIHGKMTFRAFILIPWVLPPIVASIAWQWCFNDQTGILNVVLKRLGMIQESILFIAEPATAQATVTILGGWKAYPFMMLMLLAGMQSISTELYESARMDGANTWQCFWHITMPMLKSVTLVCTTLMTIWTFNSFENIYTLTQGGPINATYVVSIYSYYVAFTRARIGYSAAISAVMLVFMMIFTVIYLRVIKRTEV